MATAGLIGCSAESGSMPGRVNPMITVTAMCIDNPEQHDRGATSLAKAFAGVAKNVGLPSAVAFHVVVIGRERKFEAGLREDLFAIGREAILNACRHSRAKHIETEIEYRSAELRITIRDDGCGIDAKRLLQSETRGLQGMCALAERIGARLRISSKIATGTEIELCVPGRIVFEECRVRGTTGIRLVNCARWVRDWIQKK
jgi:signal transduction histidine kinase